MNEINSGEITIQPQNQYQQDLLNRKEERLKQLNAATAKHKIEKRVGPGGKKLSYVPWAEVARRLNTAFDNEWSFTILEKEIINKEAVVTVRLDTCIGTQDAIASHQIQPNGAIGDAFSSAQSKALRRASSKMGIALDLYEKDTDDIIGAELANAQGALESARVSIDMPKLECLGMWNTKWDMKAKDFGEVVKRIASDKGISEVDAIWLMIDTIRLT